MVASSIRGISIARASNEFLSFIVLEERFYWSQMLIYGPKYRVNSIFARIPINREARDRRVQDFRGSPWRAGCEPRARLPLLLAFRFRAIRPLANSRALL